VGSIEEAWRGRFGEAAVDGLRRALDGLELWGGLELYPDGWRAAVRRPRELPWYPMILHRGGYPDGS
jgi:hypothetical protein